MFYLNMKAMFAQIKKFSFKTIFETCVICGDLSTVKWAENKDSFTLKREDFIPGGLIASPGKNNFPNFCQNLPSDISLQRPVPIYW